jgi:hypothetical protein
VCFGQERRAPILIAAVFAIGEIIAELIKRDAADRGALEVGVGAREVVRVAIFGTPLPGFFECTEVLTLLVLSCETILISIPHVAYEDARAIETGKRINMAGLMGCCHFVQVNNSYLLVPWTKD